MKTCFRIDGLKYGLYISESGSIALDLLGGATKVGSANRGPSDDLFWDTPYFGDINLGINTLKVFNVAKQIVLKYAFTRKPWRLGFSASTDRKVTIYRWMAARLSKKLRNYYLVEFPEGVFNFYRPSKSVGFNGAV
jgi:hypothetical protein